MQTIDDGQLRIVMDGPAGSYANNIYIVIDTRTNEAAFIDAPGEPEKSIAAAEAAGVQPTQILLTHSHPDHTAGLAELQERFGARLVADAREPWLTEGQPDQAISHGEDVRVGELSFKVVSVPGHTPGSTTYLHGRSAFVGDTLFPGGPGRTQSNADLQQEIASITGELHTLPEDTTIYPGHGDITTIGKSKEEYAGFAAREHDPDLHGDVTWADS
ncbi:MAG: hydroxyacylglutathione hydrolase family protein [Dehalococcoidia bacterium]|nr:hydroxyacylglutathione hydrolase family protein [Dehalococcoidia bacterium]